MDFFQSTLFSNIIALVALIIAIVSFIYTFIVNRPHIDLSDHDVEDLEYHSDLIKFSFILCNTSSTTIVFKEINLYSNEGAKLLHNEVKPPEKEWLKYPNPLFSPYNSYQFRTKETFIPEAKIEFSYYLTDKPKVIEINTNKLINGFSHKQKFIF
ncbi:hypothetical protein [Staphylococcus pasteuri]|uniref:hypothetical protein n=1 Tax=Staphylococcus pasteuri TaxID=45972 RepID=UPI00207C4AAD|nr:hypothetical protein [Staphylococcus pasteuri]MCO0860514.1 hypothetical protein [Staphylococcus pasteuri]